ncbi:membrane protein [Pontibacter sp. HJ8]
MTFAFAFHLFLHAAVPAIVAGLFFRPDFWRAFLLMMASMLIDVDHALADPVIDPDRCSVGYHLLHNYWLILLYLVLALIPKTRLIGLGLVIHIALDWLECIR